jgi:hypothetical protein
MNKPALDEPIKADGAYAEHVGSFMARKGKLGWPVITVGVCSGGYHCANTMRRYAPVC